MTLPIMQFNDKNDWYLIPDTSDISEVELDKPNYYGTGLKLKISKKLSLTIKDIVNEQKH